MTKKQRAKIDKMTPAQLLDAIKNNIEKIIKEKPVSEDEANCSLLARYLFRILPELRSGIEIKIKVDDNLKPEVSFTGRSFDIVRIFGTVKQ